MTAGGEGEKSEGAIGAGDIGAGSGVVRAEVGNGAIGAGVIGAGSGACMLVRMMEGSTNNVNH